MRPAYAVGILILMHVSAAMAFGGNGGFNISGGSGEDIRLAGAVYRHGVVDDALTDVLDVALSGQKGVAVVDRQQMHLILGELSLNNIAEDAWGQARLGRLLAVSTFVWVRLDGDATILEVADASSGRGLVFERGTIGDADLASLITAMAKHAVEAARKGGPPVDAKESALAFAQPISDAGEPALLQAEEAMLDVQERLQKAGVTLLQRRFVKDLSAEHWLKEKGMVAAPDQAPPLRGARYIVAARVSADDQQLTVGLLETHTGRRIGADSWPLREAHDEKTAEAITQWIRRRIEPQPAASQPATTAKPTHADLPIQPETLAPFYRGILLHNQGAYLDGAAEFRQSLLFDERFLEPYLWLESCFRGSGFDEISEELDLYLHKEQKRAAAIKNPKALHAAGGVALIGITADAKIDPALRTAVAVRLINALHEANGQPVFLAEDMTRLRDEYDTLVGLTNVAGTTWQQAPPLLFADTLTAHVESTPDGVRVRLCVTHDLDPAQVAAVSIALDREPKQWQATMAAAARALLALAPASRPVWTRPAAMLLHEPPAPGSTTARNFDALNYLKTVTRHPTDVSQLLHPYITDWFVNPIMRGLNRWFLRTLSADDPNRPFLELAQISFREWPAIAPSKTMDQLREFARKYPADPLALIAQIDVLFYEVNDDNLRESEAKLAALLNKLEPYASKLLTPGGFKFYQDADSLLRRALGMPTPPGKLIPAGFAVVPLPGNEAGKKKVWVLGANTGNEYHGPPPDPQHQAMIDLWVIYDHWRLTAGNLSTDLATKVFDRFADDPDALLYFTVTYGGSVDYGPLFNGGSTPAQMEVYRKLCSSQAQLVLDMLKKNPPTCTVGDLQNLLSVRGRLVALAGAHPELLQLAQKLEDARNDAIANERLGKLSAAQVLSLVRMSLPPDDELKLVPLMQKLAARCLTGDPLTDDIWLAHLNFPYADRYNPTMYLRRALPYYERIRALHPKPVLNDKTCWYYLHLGIIFFRSGRYDLAEEIYPALAEWDGLKGTQHDTFHANACYVLALLRHHDGNIPEALRLTQLVVETTDQHRRRGDGETMLLHFWDNNGGGGRSGSANAKIKSQAEELIATLRANPNAPFKSPFIGGDWPDPEAPKAK